MHRPPIRHCKNCGAAVAYNGDAVASAFFFYYLQRTEHGRSVSERAAARVSAREGRKVMSAC